MREPFTKTSDGQYWIEKHFAWFPVYTQGTLVWLWFYYETYLDRGNGKEYVATFPSDPRVKP